MASAPAVRAIANARSMRVSIYRNVIRETDPGVCYPRPVIVDVHTHTPTHRDAVPDDERLVFETWRNDRAVVTTNSWADFDEAQRDADVSIVFNIAVSDPLAMTGLPY